MMQNKKSVDKANQLKLAKDRHSYDQYIKQLCNLQKEEYLQDKKILTNYIKTVYEQENAKKRNEFN